MNCVGIDVSKGKSMIAAAFPGFCGYCTTAGPEAPNQT